MTRQQSGEKLGRFQQKVITMYIASNNRVVSFSAVLNKNSRQTILENVQNTGQFFFHFNSQTIRTRTANSEFYF